MSIQRNKIIATNREHPGYIDALVDALDDSSEDPSEEPLVAPDHKEFKYTLPIGYRDAISGKKHQPIRHKKIGRNELCPCGSGKKYKRCCGR